MTDVPFHRYHKKVNAHFLKGTLLAVFRWIMWWGVAVYVAGAFWDGRWHQTHPGMFESVSQMAYAHFGYWLGITLVLGSALVTIRRTPPGPRRSSAMTAALASSVSLIGTVWDSYLHATGGNVVPAHVLNWVGLLIALGAIITFTLLGRRRDTARTADA